MSPSDAVETMQTTAVSYASVNSAGEFGVDLITEFGGRDSNGENLILEEVYHWIAAPDVTEWDTDKADELLATSGWKRAGDWIYEPDLAGVEGWSAVVVEAGEPVQ